MKKNSIKVDDLKKLFEKDILEMHRLQNVKGGRSAGTCDIDCCQETGGDPDTYIDTGTSCDQDPSVGDYCV